MEGSSITCIREFKLKKLKEVEFLDVIIFLDHFLFLVELIAIF